MYILWNSRLGGWFTYAGNYSSDRKLAKVFERADALSIATKHKNNGFSEYGLLPIAIADLEAL